MDKKIEIQKLSYSAGDQGILHDVCLSVEQNQFVGLIGPNGSGKNNFAQAYLSCASSREEYGIYQRK